MASFCLISVDPIDEVISLQEDDSQITSKLTNT